MDYTIQRRMPLRWVLTSLVSVLSWECSPLALKNKPAVPVGYHTPCRVSIEGVECQQYFPSVCEGHNKHCIQQTNALEDSVPKAQKDGKFSNVSQRSRAC